MHWGYAQPFTSWPQSGGLLSIWMLLECVWNLMAHGDAREGKWRGNWRMEWVASTRILPRNVVYPTLLTLMPTPRLPAVDWTDAPADLNGLVRFGERWNLVSARVPSRFKRSIHADFTPALCLKPFWIVTVFFVHLRCQCVLIVANRTPYALSSYTLHRIINCVSPS